MKPVEVLSYTADAAAIKAATDRDGAAIVPRLLSPSQLQELNAELDPWLVGETQKPFLDSNVSSFYRRLAALAARSDLAAQLIVDERILGWAEAVLEQTGTMQLNTAQVIEIYPGAPAQMLHVDEGNWPSCVTGPSVPELMCSCMLALTEFTEQNGATRVIPGSHRDAQSQLPKESLAETVAAGMAAGSGLFFTGKVVHGGGQNRSSSARRGLTISFCAGWLRPEEAHALSISRERARQLPARLRELVGFGSYSREIGHGRVRLPLLWLHELDDAAKVLL